MTPDIHLVKSQEKKCPQCDGYIKCLCAGLEPEVEAELKQLSVQVGLFLENDLLIRRGDKFNAFILFKAACCAVKQSV